LKSPTYDSKTTVSGWRADCIHGVVPAETQHHKNSIGENAIMKNAILKIYTKAQMLSNVLRNEEGQDLVEYALVVSLIAFAAIAGMGTLATDINSAFTSIGTKLTQSV
jgi:pilus assembly protein Flp/PilA